MDSWRPVLAPVKFTGREWFFARLTSWLAQEQFPVWIIEAEPGYGKSRLVKEILKRYPDAAPMAATQEARFYVGDETDTNLLAQITGKRLLFSRPKLALSRFQGSGVIFERLPVMQAENLSDVATYLSSFPQSDKILRECGGNFGIAELIANSNSELDRLRCLWQLAEDCLQHSPNRDLSIQILTLLCETASPLAAWRICDFLGVSAQNMHQALIPLEPILKRQDDRYQVFSAYLGQAVTWVQFRDIEILHASIITYFRETFPSWEEMSDPYGWDYLVHHCDRLARTARKKDFSVLHWLGEGTFLRQKLRQGNKLPGVLQDLEHCLRAAMEESDLPRIAFYAFQLPRVRQERAASEMHKLADLSQIEKSREYALLIGQENHRLLALLLLTWQAADEQRPLLAEQLLDQALQIDSHNLFPELNLLIISICAALLKSLPTREKDILKLLDQGEHAQRTASNYLTLGLIDGLEGSLRQQILQRGWSQTHYGNDTEQLRLSGFISQSLRALKQHQLAQAWSGVISQTDLSLEEFDHSLKEQLSLDNEVERLDQLINLADKLACQQPQGWLGHGVAALTQALQNFTQPECWLRGFAQLSRLWVILGPVAEAFDGLERLSLLTQELELEKELWVRVTADLALSFYRLGDSSRSQQLISKAAAASVSEKKVEKKIASLAFVAAATAQINHASRARDLAFTLLETLEAPPTTLQDHYCRLTFRFTRETTGSSDQLLKALAQDQRELIGMGNSPRERAYLLLGLARAAYQSGDTDWATQLMQQAAMQAHQLTIPKLKSGILADLACLAWDTGQHERYRALIQETQEILATEETLIDHLEGMIDLCRALSHSKDRQARTLHREILYRLKQVSRLEVCLSSTLPRLLPLLQEVETKKTAHDLLEELRQIPHDLSLRDLDYYQAGLLHLELAYEEYDRALEALRPIISPQLRSQALVDLAVGLTSRDPGEGLIWLPMITRQADRLRAIRLILAQLGSERRPWHRQACQEALQQITMLAQENEATMDLVVSYWLTRESDHSKFEATGKRMGWLVETAPLTPLIINKA